MNSSIRPLTHLSREQRNALAAPVTIMAIIILLVILLQSFNPNLTQDQRRLSLAFSVLGLIYTFTIARFLLPFSNRYRFFHWIIALINGVGLAFIIVVFPVAAFIVSLSLAVIVLTISAILSGRWPTYLFTLIYTASNYLVTTRPDIDIPSAWVYLLSIPFVSLVITETVIRLRAIITSQMRHLEILNQVARKIAATIEPQQVISLVGAAIQEALQADTYFLALINHETGSTTLELLYDDGEFFPPQEISLDQGLGHWVITHRKSLFLRDIYKEAPALDIQPKKLGADKSSNSWMGTPLIAGNHLLGLLAVASYQKNAFSHADLELLENIAQQAALAIDNAYHHGTVEEQSRRDSLTGTYNHGYFLECLDQHAQYCLENDQSIALIMLDIDFFKQYNDDYGHLFGDQVLVGLTQVIGTHIKRTDYIGRWGGEEFAILLPDTTGAQANMVAHRVRKTIGQTTFPHRDGRQVPAPTISQGIAVFPLETDEVEALIHIADQRLYQAKSRGRNQIEPGDSHWQQIENAPSNPH